jgi:hypothetical protein
LAGFFLAAVVQLLAVNNESKLATAGIIVFSAAELNAVPSQFDNLNIGGLLLLFGAICIFIVGIGIADWMRSRLAGILTTTFAVIWV